MDDRFYITGGTLPLDADSYVTRRADTELFEYLRQGEFCYVLNTRQVGKSSLMVRVGEALRTEGVRVVLLDPTAIGVNVTVEEWYDGLLTIIAEQLSLRRELEDFWLEHPRLGPMQRWMQGLEHVALAQSEEPLCIFVDEIDSVQSLPFSADEFFGGIRECYNRRAYNPAFRRLTFCLLGVAAPVDLIADPRITPFNIGRRIELTDFTPEEAAPLASGLNHQSRKGEKEKRRKGEGEIKETRNFRGAYRQEDALPLSSDSFSPFLLFSFSPPLNRILYWTGGHPYLTQKLCSALAQRTGVPTRAEVDAVCSELFLSRRAQKTDDNLVFARSRLLYEENHRGALLDVYQRILDGRKIRDDATNPLHNILRLSGIVQAENGLLTVRNRIYAHVFNKQWARDNMPGEELRRQRAAYRRGLWRAVGLSSGVVVALAALTLVAWQQARIAQQKTNIAREKTEFANQETIIAQQKTALAKQKSEEASRSAQLARDSLTLANRRKHDLNIALTSAKNSAATSKNLAAARAKAIRDLEQEKQVADASARRANKMAADKAALVTSLGRSLEDVKRNKDQADLNLYNADMDLTQRAVESGNVREAVDLLQATAHSKYRHFEWDYWNRALHLERRTFGDKQAAMITSVAFFPDGNRFAAGGVDGKVRIWEAASGKLALTLPADRSAVIAVACSPDGETIATGGHEGKVRIWDAKTGKKIRELPHQTNIAALAYSPDGSRLVTAGGQNVGAKGAGVFVWNVEKEAIERAFTNLPFLSNSVVFSPDGGRILAGTTDRRGILFNVATGKQEQDFQGHTSEVTAVAMAPNGKYVVTVSRDHTARLWDAATGKIIYQLQGHLVRLTSAAFSPDSKWVVTAGADNSCRIWNVDTGLEAMRLTGHARPVNSVTYSPDGNFILTGSEDGTVKIWAAHDSGKALELAATSGMVTSLAYSPDGNYLVTGLSTNIARVWDTRTGKVAFTLPKMGTFDAYIECVTFSRDGKTLATGSRDGTARVWDAQTGRELQKLLCRTVQVSSVSFSPDGKRLATGLDEGMGVVWEWKTGRRLQEMKTQQSIKSLEFSPDGKTIVTGYMDHRTILWDAQTGAQRQEFKGNESYVFSVAFSPDGRRVVTGGGDSAARVFDVATGRQIYKLQGHREWVKSVAYSRDGRRILTGSFDKTARLWDAETGRELLLLPDTAYVNAVAFAPDGKHIATASQDGGVKIWPAATTDN